MCFEDDNNVCCKHNDELLQMEEVLSVELNKVILYSATPENLQERPIRLFTFDIPNVQHVCHYH